MGTREITMAVAARELNTNLRMSWEEFLEWADDQTHAEWVDGEVIPMSPATLLHTDIQQFLLALFRLYAESRSGGTVLGDPFLMHLPRQKRGRIPDVFYVSTQRLGLLKDTYMSDAADIAVEIVSPDSIRRDRVEKMKEYELAGVREYWLIDLTMRTAEFFILGVDEKYSKATLEEDGVFRSTVLEGFWLNANWFWSRPLPKILDVLRLWGLI